MTYKSNFLFYVLYIKLSIFFDILLACCSGISKEKYLSGSFKTNHTVPQNQLSILRQARVILWSKMQSYKIHNITVLKDDCISIYVNNETLETRKNLFDNYERFLQLSNTSNIFYKLENHKNNINLLNTQLNHSNVLFNSDNKINKRTFLINSILDNSIIKFESNVAVVNCEFKNSKAKIGKNCFLNDLKLVKLFFKPYYNRA
jgi:hypothetical protein